MSGVTWRRMKDPLWSTTAGWEAFLDGRYIGSVWLDGGYTRHGNTVYFRSHARAAEELLLQVARDLRI